MKRDLYFIPILCRAFDEPDRAAALRRAFAEIERLGRFENYRVGLRQFHRFMKEAYTRPVPHLLLEKDRSIIARIVPGQTADEVRITGIVPGTYSLRLDTGRLLWTAGLEAKDVLWAEAFPSTPLRLAADSHGTQKPCSRELKLGKLLLRVYPGLEGGTLGIRICT